MQQILKYFPDITEAQKGQFNALQQLYADWNSKINVISRKDIDQLYERHVLHSLAIAKVLKFKDRSRILDVGTGGGFPGIPLAIMFPDCEFLLIDSIAKKIKVVSEVADATGLKNVTAKQARAEEIKEPFEFVVSRAVTAFPQFVAWVGNNISKQQKNALPNGILYLKGGDLKDEMAQYWKKATLFDIPDFFTEEFFITKKVVYLPI